MEPQPDEIDVTQALRIIARRWRAAVVVVSLFVFVGVALALVTPRRYSVTAAFVPEVGSSNRLPAGLAGVAGQFGIAFGDNASHSPRFYADVSRSLRVLTDVLMARYPDPRPGRSLADSASLLDLLEVDGRDAADSLQRGLRMIGRLLNVRADNQTNIVRLTVSARYPSLAADVANRIVAVLNAFNTQTRQSQARERRKFVETQLAAEERELRRREDELRAFYDGNRTWEQAPQLRFEEGRLRRQLEVQQEVYLTVRREFEGARIEEVNSTPVITVIDKAIPPTRHSKPSVVTWGVVAFTLGVVASLIWVFGAELIDRARVVPVRS